MQNYYINSSEYYFYLYFIFSNQISTLMAPSPSNIAASKPVNVLKDLLCGNLSGILTGFFFMFPEYFKVHKQVHRNDPNFSILQALKDKSFHKKLLKGTATFPPLVGCVGAVEFACNDKIREIHGKAAGILASALSGAFFLTIADHFMLRQEKFGENYRTAGTFLWNKRGFLVGYLGITLREAIFMTNMIYVGPWTGRLMQRISDSPEGEQMSMFWNFLGRSTSGLISTFVSHPFDIASRTQQISFGEKGGKIPLFHTLFELHRQHLQQPRSTKLFLITNHPWLAGVMWRMWLGTFGGACLGGFYEYFSKQYDRMNQ